MTIEELQNNLEDSNLDQSIIDDIVKEFKEKPILNQEIPVDNLDYLIANEKDWRKKCSLIAKKISQSL